MQPRIPRPWATAMVLLPLAALAGCSAGPWSRGPLFSRSAATVDGSTVIIDGPDEPQASALDRAASAYRKTTRKTAEVSSRWYTDTSANFRRGWDQLVQAFERPQADALSEPLTDEAKARLHLAAAAVCEGREDYAQAMEYYDLALETDPDLIEARVGRARLFHRRGLIALAIKEYGRAMEENPDDPMVLNDLGMCYARQGDLAKAEQLFRRAIDQRPREVRYRNNLAALLVRTDNTAGALETLNPVVGQAAAHYNVAHFLNEQGKQSEAWRHFDQAAQLDPTLADARQMANRLAAHAPIGTSR